MDHSKSVPWDVDLAGFYCMYKMYVEIEDYNVICAQVRNETDLLSLFPQLRQRIQQQIYVMYKHYGSIKVWQGISSVYHCHYLVLYGLASLNHVTGGATTRPHPAQRTRHTVSHT